MIVSECHIARNLSMLSITLRYVLYLLVDSRKGNALKKIISKIGLGDLLPKLHLGLVVNEIYPTKCPFY